MALPCLMSSRTLSGRRERSGASPNSSICGFRIRVVALGAGDPGVVDLGASSRSHAGGSARLTTAISQGATRSGRR